MFADAREDDHRQAVAQGGCEGIDQRLAEVQHVGRETEGEFLRDDRDRDAEDGAVRGDQGQEDTEGLVEGRTHLLQHDLHHLHEGGDHQDEGDRLQELELEGNEEVLVDEVSHQRGEGDDEAHGH